MASRVIVAENRAKALNRIEAALPQKFIETLPGNSDVRLNMVLDYVATALEKRTAKAPPPPPVEDTPPPSEPNPEPEPEPA